MSRSDQAHTCRFKDGFGSISAIAAVLAKVICGMNLVEAQQEDKASFGALSESDKHEARHLDSAFRRWPELRSPTHESRFADKQKEMTAVLLTIAAQERWVITDSDGVPQIPARAFGHIDVSLVRDWFDQARAPNHSAFAKALTQSLQGEGDLGTHPDDGSVTSGGRHAMRMSDPEHSGPSMGLTTGEIGQVFAFVPNLKKKLGDTNNHRWVLKARLSKGVPPAHATWCPLTLAKILDEREDLAVELNRAFLSHPLLHPWRTVWQEDRKARNAFGQ